MKKTLIFLVAFIIAISCLIIRFSASKYYSTLSIGTGQTFQGATRPYTAGVNKLTMVVDNFTKVNGLEYTKVRVTLYSGDGTQLGSSVMKFDDDHHSCTIDFGYQQEGEKYYSFSTIVDGYSYGNLYSNFVTMSSDKEY